MHVHSCLRASFHFRSTKPNVCLITMVIIHHMYQQHSTEVRRAGNDGAESRRVSHMKQDNEIHGTIH